jgi:hypothetical protein
VRRAGERARHVLRESVDVMMAPSRRAGGPLPAPGAIATVRQPIPAASGFACAARSAATRDQRRPSRLRLGRPAVATGVAVRCAPLSSDLSSALRAGVAGRGCGGGATISRG